MSVDVAIPGTIFFVFFVFSCIFYSWVMKILLEDGVAALQIDDPQLWWARRGSTRHQQ